MNAFERIRTYLRDRAIAADADAFRRGYDYAAGALLRGTHPHDLAVEADGVLYPAQFDRGMTLALRDWGKS